MMLTLSTIGSWALVVYILGATAVIVHKTIPEGDHHD